MFSFIKLSKKNRKNQLKVKTQKIFEYLFTV
jgi:hypothetical protein